MRFLLDYSNPSMIINVETFSFSTHHFSFNYSRSVQDVETFGADIEPAGLNAPWNCPTSCFLKHNKLISRIDVVMFDQEIWTRFMLFFVRSHNAKLIFSACRDDWWMGKFASWGFVITCDSLHSLKNLFHDFRLINEMQFNIERS